MINIISSGIKKHTATKSSQHLLVSVCFKLRQEIRHTLQEAAREKKDGSC